MNRNLGLILYPLAILLMIASAGCMTRQAQAEEKVTKMRVYIGTYTGKTSQGIYMMDMDTSTGELSKPVLAGKYESPSFLAIHPSGKYLYAVSETAKKNEGGKLSGDVAAFAISATDGTLTFLNQQKSGGAHPCHITVDAAGKVAYLANYTGGNIESLTIGDDGKLSMPIALIDHVGKNGPDKGRQDAAHAHSINPDPTGKYVITADLGLDRLFAYATDGKGGMTLVGPAAVLAPGNGPRHVSFHPTLKVAYCINELSSSITVLGYETDASKMQEKQTVGTLPAGLKVNNSTAEVLVHPSGKFVYGSNRGHDSIAVYTVDPKSGELTMQATVPCGGKTPRNFCIDPSGKFLLVAHQDSDSVLVFKINEVTGMLEETANKVEVGKPVCIRFYSVAKK